MCLISPNMSLTPRHPLLHTLPGTRLPRKHARCTIDSHRYGTPTPGIWSLACQPHSCTISSPSVQRQRQQRQQLSQVRPACTWLASVAVPIYTVRIIMFHTLSHLELTHIASRCCRQLFLPPCLKADDKLRGSAARCSKAVSFVTESCRLPWSRRHRLLSFAAIGAREHAS